MVFFYDEGQNIATPDIATAKTQYVPFIRSIDFISFL